MIIDIIKNILEHTDYKIGELAYRPGEPMEFYTSIEKITSLTGWIPKWSIKQGLESTLNCKIWEVNVLPWIKKEDCIGCGICVEKCPVNAIYMIDKKAEINMNECIRCGTCHKVCPQEAVRHDSERIPQEIEANIEWTKQLLKKYKTKNEKLALIQRIERHFLKEKKVIEKTLERLKSFQV